MTDDRDPDLGLKDLLNSRQAARQAARQRRERDDPLADAYLDGANLPDALLNAAADPTPWWEEYAETDVPADPDDVADGKRLCVAEGDKARSPFYPEVEPPELPPEAREAGVTREDLQPDN